MNSKYNDDQMERAPKPLRNLHDTAVHLHTLVQSARINANHINCQLLGILNPDHQVKSAEKADRLPEDVKFILERIVAAAEELVKVSSEICSQVTSSGN